MVNIAPFPYRLTPMANVSPVTYRDGTTYLLELEAIKEWLNKTLVPHVDDSVADVTAQYQAGIDNAEATVTAMGAEWAARYDAFIANFTNELKLLNEAAVGGMVTGPSVVRDNLLTLIDTEIVAATTANHAYTDQKVADLGTVTAGQLADLDATKLDTTAAAATYQTLAGAETDRGVNLTKTGAAALYPTKQNVIDGRAPDKRSRTRGGTTAFLGDSYMAGVQIPNQADRWTSRYAVYGGFTESNHAVSSAGFVNEGVTGTGRTANQAANIPLGTDRVIICAGINDTSFTGPQIANGVTDTIGAIRTRVPAAEIVVLSPMWWNAQPSDALRTTERYIRNAIPADVRYVEGAMWLRQGRPDMQVSDGHPNELGSLLIARWVQAKLDNTGPGGALEGSFERDGLTEDEVVTSAGAGVGLAFGTIYDARPGKWRLSFDLTCYGTSDGFVWIGIAGQRLTQRWGINTSGTYPVTLNHSVEVRHPGGDLVLDGGMTMNNPINVLETGTRVKADWVTD